MKTVRITGLVLLLILAVVFPLAFPNPAVTTVVLYFVTAEDGGEASAGTPPKLAVLPWLGAGKGGVSVAGRF